MTPLKSPANVRYWACSPVVVRFAHCGRCSVVPPPPLYTACKDFFENAVKCRTAATRPLRPAAPRSEIKARLRYLCCLEVGMQVSCVGRKCLMMFPHIHALTTPNTPNHCVQGAAATTLSMVGHLLTSVVRAAHQLAAASWEVTPNPTSAMTTKRAQPLSPHRPFASPVALHQSAVCSC